MLPKIAESYSQIGVNVGRIVKRIIRYAPPSSLQGLNEIRIKDKDPDNRCFSSYSKQGTRIELFVDDIVGWYPWLLKKSFILPYLAIGLALGHEIDHHVHRNHTSMDKEKSAESNALRYVYPSFGIFKPIARILFLLFRKSGRFINKQGVAWDGTDYYDGLIAKYTKALEMNPRDAEAYYNRGVAWDEKDDWGRAIADYTKALEINPCDSDAISNRAWLLATCPDSGYRDGQKALESAQKAMGLNPGACNLDILAAAYAETGQFEEAIATQKKAIALLKESDIGEELTVYKQRLRTYETHKPWREKSRTLE